MNCPAARLGADVSPTTPGLVSESPTTPPVAPPPEGATDTPYTPVSAFAAGGGKACEPEVPITPVPNFPVAASLSQAYPRTPTPSLLLDWPHTPVPPADEFCEYPNTARPREPWTTPSTP